MVEKLLVLSCGLRAKGRVLRGPSVKDVVGRRKNSTPFPCNCRVGNSKLYASSPFTAMSTVATPNAKLEPPISDNGCR